MEVPATNIRLSHVNITASKSFDVYNVAASRFADSQIIVPKRPLPSCLYNAQLIITNSRVLATNLVTLDGLTTNGMVTAWLFTTPGVAPKTPMPLMMAP